jgi:hypothetical protein
MINMKMLVSLDQGSQLGHYTGSTVPSVTVVTPSNIALVRFRTDYSSTYTGFVLTFTTGRMATQRRLTACDISLMFMITFSLTDAAIVSPINDLVRG